MNRLIVRATLFSCCLWICFDSAASSPCEPQRLADELEELHDLDQATRTGLAPNNDSHNRLRLREIVESCGWPSADTVGRKAAMGAFLVLQHAPLDMQLEFMPLLERAAEKGQLIPGTLPYLQDRALVRRGRPQIFGTQFSIDCELHEISKPEKVDALREAAGLIPLKEYVEHCREQRGDQ